MRPIEKRIPLSPFDRHKAFGCAGVLPSGKHFLAYRDGSEHGVKGGGVLKFIIRNGLDCEWSVPVEIMQRENKDVRGASGGVTSQGTIVLFVRVQRGTGGTGYLHETWVLRSTDEGSTWTETMIHASETNFVCPYGSLVEYDGQLFHASYRGPAVAFVMLKSSDDGQNFTVSVARTVFPSGTSFTEPEICHIGGGRFICVARDNAAVDSEALFMWSNGGDVWSAATRLDNISLGKNPPLMDFNPETNLILLLWPSRGPTRMAAGGTGRLYPFYYSYIDADVMWAAGGSQVKWRTPMPLPLYTSYFIDGNTDGDGGYPYILHTEEGRVMLYYKGNAGPGFGGTDYFEAHLEPFLSGF